MILLAFASGCTTANETTTVPPTTGSPVTGATSTTALSASTTTIPSATGGQATQSARLSPTTGAFSTCKDCHAYLDVPGKVPATLMKNFSHEAHLRREGVQCASCHVQPVHRPEGIRKPLMADCFHCHGQAADARAPGGCGLCHPADFRRVPSTHTAAFRRGGHSKVAEQQGREECVICHSGKPQTLCRGCHGLDLPHPGGWTGTGGESGAHAQAAHDNPKRCTPCHHNRLDRPGGCYGGECHGS